MKARSINRLLVGATLVAVTAGLVFARLADRNRAAVASHAARGDSVDPTSETRLSVVRKTPGFGETIAAATTESLTFSARTAPQVGSVPRTHPLAVATTAETPELPLVWREITRELTRDDIALPRPPPEGYLQLRPLPRLSQTH